MDQHVILEGQDEVRSRAFQQALLKDLAALESLCDTGMLEEGVSRANAGFHTLQSPVWVPKCNPSQRHGFTLMYVYSLDA
jgi:hypothetical protein